MSSPQPLPAEPVPLVKVPPELFSFTDREIFNPCLNALVLAIPDRRMPQAVILRHDILDAKMERGRLVMAEWAALKRSDRMRVRQLRARRFRVELWLIEAHRDLIALAKDQSVGTSGIHLSLKRLIAEAKEAGLASP